MKKLLIASSIVALSSVAQAGTVFSDSFEANTLGLNITPSGWNVTTGTVDIIGAGFYDFIPGSGKYIDLDGSTNNPGILSKTLSLIGGTQYFASFDLAGNHRTNTPDTVTGIFGVGLGNVSATFSLGQNVGWTTYSLVFTPTATSTYVLSFENSGNDNMGMLLDNVKVVTAPVPEPETYAMMLAGLGLLGVMTRRRKQKAVA